MFGTAEGTMRFARLKALITLYACAAFACTTTWTRFLLAIVLGLPILLLALCIAIWLLAPFLFFRKTHGRWPWAWPWRGDCMMCG